MSVFREFLRRVKATGARRPGVVTTTSMGLERVFCAYDVGPDTFIVEKGVGGHLGEHPSVLIVEKSALRRRASGRVMTVSTARGCASPV